MKFFEGVGRKVHSVLWDGAEGGAPRKIYTGANASHAARIGSSVPRPNPLPRKDLRHL